MTSPDGALIDTNIIIYARERDSRDPRSRAAARLLEKMIEADSAVLSTQVLLETCDVLVRGARPCDRQDAIDTVVALGGICRVLPTGADTLGLAFACARHHGLRIFDATIWAAAAEAGISFVLSEDFGHRRVIGGVTFLDPFAPDFAPDEIGLTGLEP